jgi:DNA polymerase-3 subunit gamma/tau
VKVVPAVADDVAFAESERLRGRGFAEKLSMRVLARAWQMLLKGITEVEASGRPLAAAEMVLVRLAYAADLPTPDEVIRSLGNQGAAPAPRPGGNGGAGATAASGPSASRFEGSRGDTPRGSPRAALAAVQPVGDAMDAPAEKIAPVLAVDSFEGLIALAVQKRDLSVKAALERDVRLVRCEDGRLDVALEPSASKTLVNNLSDKFTQWTGRRWVVVVSREAAQPTVKSVLEAKQAELKTGVQADPLVQAVMARFPGATIVDVRAADQTAALPPGDPEEMLPEEPPPADEDSYGADWMRDEDRED